MYDLRSGSLVLLLLRRAASMKLFRFALLVSLVCCFSCGGFATAAPIEARSTSLTTAIQANNSFAIDLYKILQDTGKEWIFSPCSIFQALGMAQAGARGETADQLARALHVENNPDRLHGGLGQAVAGIIADSKDEGYELSVVNAIWRQKNQSLRKKFRIIVSKHYGAGLYAADFKNNPDSSLDSMQTWLSRVAGGRIDNFFKAGLFETSTQAVLVSSVRMKVSAEQFALASDRSKKELADKGNPSLDTLVDNDENHSLILFLTTQQALQEDADEDNVAKWVPVFPGQAREASSKSGTLQSFLNLRSILEQVQVEEAFSDDADFSGITGSKNTGLAHVIHGAWVKRSSDGGFEAMAVTLLVFDDAVTSDAPIVLSSILGQ